MTDTRQDRLEAIMKRVNKDMGEGSLQFASKSLTRKVPRIPCGVPELDAALGGGIPMSRNTLLRGQKSVGKSLLMYLTMIAAERFCRQCVTPIWERDMLTKEKVYLGCSCGANEPGMSALIDCEGSFDPSWYTKLGGDPELLLHHRPDTGEDAIDVAEALILSGSMMVVGLDSIAALIPSVEVENSVGKMQMAPQAQLGSKAYRKIQSALIKAEKEFQIPSSAFITVNQQRNKVGVVYGSPITYPGGEALNNFFPAVTVEFKRVETILGPASTKTEPDPIGQVSGFMVSKNKTAPPFRRGQVALYFRHIPEWDVRPGDTDFGAQVVRMAVLRGIIVTKGSWYSMYDGTKLGQGDKKAAVALLEKDLLMATYDACVALDSSGHPLRSPLPEDFKMVRPDLDVER